MAKRGPKTEEGRNAVRLNAWKHGINSELMAVPNYEDPTEWEAHRDGTIESLVPEGHLEHMLAERVAILLWKLRRIEFVVMHNTVDRMRSAQGDIEMARNYGRGIFGEDAFPKEVTQQELDFAQSGRMIPGNDNLNTIIRYEANLQRLYVQTLHELEALQARRNGQHTPLARFDVSRSTAL